jgi:hypothetical protein
MSLTWKVTIAISAALGLVSQVYFFTWRLSVAPGPTLKDSNPFTSMFVLQNDGQFSLYAIQFSCTSNTVKTANHIQFERMLGSTQSYDVAELAANDRTSTPCFVGYESSGPVLSADITLNVSYRPSFSPFRRSKHFRFTATRKDDGTYAWIQTALE